MDYKCSAEYFREKYGREQSEAAISWWNELPIEQRKQISPRRLDYALHLYSLSGDLRDVLPASSGISKLLHVLATGPTDKKLAKLFGDVKEAKKFLAIENNYDNAIDYIIRKNKWRDFFLPLIHKEKLSALISSNSVVMSHVIEHANNPQYPDFFDVLKHTYEFSATKKARRRIMAAAQAKNSVLANRLSPPAKVTMASTQTSTHQGATAAIVKWGDKPIRPSNTSAPDWIPFVSANPRSTTLERVRTYDLINRRLPETLSEGEAIHTLNVMNSIARRSYAQTFRSMPAFFMLVNHCYSQCLKQKNIQRGTSAEKSYFTQFAGSWRYLVVKAGITGAAILFP